MSQSQTPNALQKFRFYALKKVELSDKRENFMIIPYIEAPCIAAARQSAERRSTIILAGVLKNVKYPKRAIIYVLKG